MGGAILNMITVAMGSLVGLLVGNRLPKKMQESVVTGMGLVTIYFGVSNTGQTGNIIIPLLSIAFGAIIGEMLDIQAGLERFAGWLQSRFAAQTPAANDVAATGDSPPTDSRARFITGFVTASLVFCVGPLTFIGSIQDGMGLAVGFQQIAIKSILDMFTSMVFAASFGVGVTFSILTILLVQGGLSLLGMALGNFMSTPMVNEMTSVGGLLLIGLALILLDIKKPRVANFLPALLIAPLIVVIATALGINIYPL